MNLLNQTITARDLGTLEIIVSHILDGTFEDWVRSLPTDELENVRRVFAIAKSASTEMKEESMLEIRKMLAEEADANIDVSQAKEYLKKFQLNH